ncbi:X-Pro dipeptidyl-peptidase protein [Hyaloscypha sp. PMI_1271]|nr:X-Pro dipeptidyl-peptidase protein [Hyaloscypha sp. PMI_1271]
MPNQIRDLHAVDDKSFPYIFEQNATVPLKTSSGLVRVNVYRPKDAEGKGGKHPVLVTYGPYGKDIYYGDFHPGSFAELNPEHKSPHSAWETPDPGFWTRNGYAVVRADERGLGQSPGFLDTMSRGTSEAFFDVVEWAADQPWSTGKVGLLGISYFAGSQWRVAAQQPKGLSAIVPWEGMSDYYRDRCRHGGILSNEFIKFWWERQIVSNQYGKGGKAARKWGPDTIEGDLSEEELKANRKDQNIDNANNQFRDQRYYASKEYNKEDITVPVLSVANWGGILLHLRGNVEGYTQAGSELKYLRFITGRHDLPFYYKEEVEVQKSFLDAFLKDDDRVGWSVPGKLPPVDVVLRKGDVGFNDAAAERVYTRRTETEWPIARTQYTPYYLAPSLGLSPTKPTTASISKVSYVATGFEENDGREIGAVSQGWKPLADAFDLSQQVSFTTAPFEVETEITGHITAHLNVSVSPTISGISPSEIDLFVTLRHISSAGKEVFYTGTAGNPVPLCKGWLRTSLRKVNKEHINHREWLPHRDYFSSDVLPVIPGEVYPVDVEVWPTNVVLSPGSKLVFEVSSGDTQGCERFKHTSPTDRPREKLAGMNHIHFGPRYENFVTLPIIPPK